MSDKEYIIEYALGSIKGSLDELAKNQKILEENPNGLEIAKGLLDMNQRMADLALTVSQIEEE